MKDGEVLSTTSRPKLPLTQEERVNLRKSKVKINEIHEIGLDHLTKILNVSQERTRIIRGLATFQQVPSIGIKLAEKIVHNLGIYSLKEIKDKNGAELLDTLEEQMGIWTDPCVEDQIRCVIYYANNPDSNRHWFDFTEERKAYRQLNGYPSSRPVKAWYE